MLVCDGPPLAALPIASPPFSARGRAVAASAICQPQAIARTELLRPQAARERPELDLRLAGQSPLGGAPFLRPLDREAQELERLPHVTVVGGDQDDIALELARHPWDHVEGHDQEGAVQ